MSESRGRDVFVVSWTGNLLLGRVHRVATESAGGGLLGFGSLGVGFRGGGGGGRRQLGLNLHTGGSYIVVYIIVESFCKLFEVLVCSIMSSVLTS